jgi:hypothetical protein
MGAGEMQDKVEGLWRELEKYWRPKWENMGAAAAANGESERFCGAEFGVVS